MFDTLKVQWRGISYGDGFKEWLLSEYPTAQLSRAAYSDVQPWEGAFIKDKKLGVIGIKSSRTGNALTAERSIPKYLLGDNEGLLSASQAVEAASAWVSDVQARFAGWWELPNYAQTAVVKRIDLCYQQPVAASSEVFPYVHAALSTRKASLYEFIVPNSRSKETEIELPKIQLHLSGVSYNQNRWEHARWYDKGLESGNEMYLNVVRHEEEIKGGKAGVVGLIMGGRFLCDREHARERMNARYEGWGPCDGYDLASLLSQHGTQGAAAALMVVCPQHETLCKQYLSKPTFYRLKALAMDARRKMVPYDLRLPVDAWCEKMV
jgi:hypothetical protein